MNISTIVKSYIVLLICLHIVLAACNTGKKEKQEKSKEVISCDQSLDVLIRHSNWNSSFKKDIKATIENVDGEKIRIQLTTATNSGTNTENTVGWLIIDREKRTISDITDDLENPEIVNYQITDWNRFASCFQANESSRSQAEPILQISDLFSEGSTTTFTPEDLSKPDRKIKEFKVKLAQFDQQHKDGNRFNIKDLSPLINNEIFDNSKTFVNSSWLDYFLSKYRIKPIELNSIFDLAVSQEDYNAIKIMLKHGFIISSKQLQKAQQTKEVSARLTKYNLENNGLDESGDPTFYDEENSKIDAIEKLLNLHYNANAIQDKDGFTNLRESKSKTSGIIKQIKSAEKVKVLDNTGEWWLVETLEGHQGYIYWTRVKSFGFTIGG